MLRDQSKVLARASWLCAALLPFAVLAAPVQSARASDGEVVSHLALFEVPRDGVHDDLARRLTDALRREVLATPGHQLSDARVSLEQLSLVQDCDPEELSCLGKIARQLGVGGCIYGQMQSDSSGATVELKLFDASGQTIKRTARAKFPHRAPSEADVSETARTLVAQLIGPAAEPAENLVAPTPQSEVTPAAVAASAAASDDGVSGQQVAGYALLGGAALSVGLSVLAFVEIDRAQSNESFDKYRKAVGRSKPDVKDVCDEAESGVKHGLDSKSFTEVKDECSAGRTFEVLQFVFLGAAAVSGGLSAYLLLSDDSGERRPTALLDVLPVQPVVRKNSAELRAKFRF